MNLRPRYTVQEPPVDYHGQGIPPRHEKTRPLRNAGKQSQETGHTNTHHKEGIRYMTTVADTTPPSGWTPEYNRVPMPNGTWHLDTNSEPPYWIGAEVETPGVSMYAEYTHVDGIRVMSGDGDGIAVDDLPRLAAQIMRVHNTVLAAHRERR